MVENECECGSEYHIFRNDDWCVLARPLHTAPGDVELSISSASATDPLWLRRYLYPSPDADSIRLGPDSSVQPDSQDRTRFALEVCHAWGDTPSIEGVAPLSEHSATVAGYAFTVRLFPGKALTLDAVRLQAGERIGVSHPREVAEVLDESWGHLIEAILFVEEVSSEELRKAG
jgi:hypothetical protein